MGIEKVEYLRICDCQQCCKDDVGIASDTDTKRDTAGLDAGKKRGKYALVRREET